MTSRYIAVCIPRTLSEKIDQQVSSGLFSSKADFLKQSIRRELAIIAETQAHQREARRE